MGILGIIMVIIMIAVCGFQADLTKTKEIDPGFLGELHKVSGKEK